MNQKINDLSSNGIDVHTSINISHSDYYYRLQSMFMKNRNLIL